MQILSIIMYSLITIFYIIVILNLKNIIKEFNDDALKGLFKGFLETLQFAIRGTWNE